MVYQMISYGDSEVRAFHPLCKKALEYALRATGNDTNYKVVHHRYTGALEMDFAIENIATGKYLCVVEVKRTPADVNSTRYQYQAMSYVQMNAGMTEAPFYMITNLERTIAFRYDASKPKVFQQMLQPGLVKIGDFSSFNREGDLVDALGDYFKVMLEDFIANRYHYFFTLGDFAETMESAKKSQKRWKSYLAIMLYEYIRGVFHQVNRGGDLHDIRIFHRNIEQICHEGARIDFKGIFEYSSAAFDLTAAVPNHLLADLFDYGTKNISGDAIAGVLHQIVSDGNEHKGEVPTDLELARLVAILAHHISGEIQDGEYICDPAAGSGNLLSSAIVPYRLKPCQIKANDCNIQLMELLSLRLGLNYASKISWRNAPEVSCKDITSIERIYFAGVRTIVMNPPFIAGIYCVSRKRPFFERIRELCGRKPLTEQGQMPLEAVFLELICELADVGTTVACIFPKTHLVARGEESKTIRYLLLSKFGIKTIFTYPGAGIFENVVKDTCVIIGTVKQENENVEVISSYEEIRNIDYNRFEKAIGAVMDEDFSSIMPGISGKSIRYESLWKSISEGWRELSAEMMDAAAYVNSYLNESLKLKKLGSYHYSIKRGVAANKGGSDLLFFDSRKELYDAYESKVHLCAGMRNSKTMHTLVIGEGDSRFLDVSMNKEEVIDDIIRFYMALPSTSGKQIKKAKSRMEWKNILESESKGVFPANSVLIPRAIRADGRAFLALGKVFVSTNFVVWSLPEYKKALLASTWMTTIFYQLICEVFSKGQEGMRKMEVADISCTLVPDFDNLSQDIILKLEEEKDNISFLKLNHPKIRKVDRIWAEELFGEEAEVRLQEAANLLQYQVLAR